MGLDQFKTDNNKDESSSSSSSNSTSSTTTAQTRKDNTPSYMTQAFTDHKEVSPRAIKYQIKSVMPKFTYTFSISRFDVGELVAYSTSAGEQSVVVHTTIQSHLQDEFATENKCIEVYKWDAKQEEQVSKTHQVEYSDSWKMKLRGAILSLLD